MRITLQGLVICTASTELVAQVAQLKVEKEQLRAQLLLLQSHMHAATQAEQQRNTLVKHFFTLFNSMTHTQLAATSTFTWSFERFRY
ncbi:unnamed protein product [Closterium sp. Naga37s-1]|nr:unnamed protein product [Closterium sp. Naga37s-1]